MLIQVKVQIVCKDDVVECLFITGKLLLMTMRIASVKVIVANILCLDIENRHTILTTGDIVRCTALLPFGFVNDAEFGQKALH